jgi:uncharacterized membrane protein
VCEHKQRVNETHKRSLLKGVSMRVIEVSVDTALLTFLGVPIFESIGASIGIEALCFLVCYINERIWNKIQWGRKVV